MDHFTKSWTFVMRHPDLLRTRAQQQPLARPTAPSTSADPPEELRAVGRHHCHRESISSHEQEGTYHIRRGADLPQRIVSAEGRDPSDPRASLVRRASRLAAGHAGRRVPRTGTTRVFTDPRR